MLRVLRCMAILCIGSGGISIVVFVLRFIAYRFPSTLYSSHTPLEIRLDLIVELLAPGVAVILTLGGLGLFLWRRWGITLLRIWCVMEITLSLSRAVLSVMAMSMLRTTRPQTNPPSMVLVVVMSLLAIGVNSVLPLLILYIVSRREVTNLWSTDLGGFDILPVSRATESL